jgi:site-specific DNA recombinase
VTTSTTRRRFIGYVRVSTTDQAEEGVSLEAQRAKLQAWALATDAELVEVVADEGVSAKSLERPGLQRVLEQLEAGAVDGLVVTKLDRLTRSTRDLLALVDTFFGEGRHQLASVQEQIDTTSAAGRLMLTILGAIAAWERETIGERTKDALRHLSSQGVRLGGEGYGWARTTERDSEGRLGLQPIGSEVATIDRAKVLRAEGHSLRSIASTLTLEGHRTKRGGRWHAKTVRSLVAV